MKNLFAICLIISAPLAWTGNSVAATPAAVQGTVLEVKDVEPYTYLRLQTKDGETWAAVSQAPVKKGAQVTIENAMVMSNFESTSLKRTFPKILFGSLGGSGSGAHVANVDMAAAHAGINKTQDIGNIQVTKASGANAKTVAEVITQAGKLKDQSILVRGKIVKYNPGIMGKNWIHLRDGSGSAANDTHDILVTSMEKAQLGEVVTVKGVVHTNKDFGAGYSYKVVIEEASLKRN